MHHPQQVKWLVICLFIDAQELEAYGDAAGAATGYTPQDDAMHDCILLGACGPNQVLPQSPELPADIFTACLTTPIRVRPSCMPGL